MERKAAIERTIRIDQDLFQRVDERGYGQPAGKERMEVPATCKCPTCQPNASSWLRDGMVPGELEKGAKGKNQS